MKKGIALVVGMLMLAGGSLKADEGMWLLPLLEKLNMDKMTPMGLKLSAEDIYSINHSSLKDAVVIFGRGCTGEIISGEGLLLTNHHCGYDAIQNHSSVGHNYLEKGFWAMTREEELPNPGLTATFLIRMEDVTPRVLVNLNDTLPEELRNEKIKKISREIAENATRDNHYKALVRSFFDGIIITCWCMRNIMMSGWSVHLLLPSEISGTKRTTGCGQGIRVISVSSGVCGARREAAAYSTRNIPLKPKHFLPVS